MAPLVVPTRLAPGQVIECASVRAVSSELDAGHANDLRKTEFVLYLSYSRNRVCVLKPHLKHRFPHQSVDHTIGQHVVGAVHTNTIEGFWSILKRGVVGTYHKVSKKYLHLYVAEFQFRYNNRQNPDIFGTHINGC
jgi:hypothetical protein